MKNCKKCNTEKHLTEYSKNKRNKDGLDTICRECMKIKYQENRESKLESHKKWREKNKDYQKEWEKKQGEKLVKYRKEYYKENREKWI